MNATLQNLISSFVGRVAAARSAVQSAVKRVSPARLLGIADLQEKLAVLQAAHDELEAQYSGLSSAIDDCVNEDDLERMRFISSNDYDPDRWISIDDFDPDEYVEKDEFNEMEDRMSELENEMEEKIEQAVESAVESAAEDSELAKRVDGIQAILKSVAESLSSAAEI